MINKCKYVSILAHPNLIFSKGTCLTSTECSDKSGNVDGSCASGFGVCCTFK